ncbi:polymorphic toxin type 43 domain-containing protein [Paenactinomyces guangxiensis]|uniref:Bacterial toxin 43 domain-containing protein n=1 Tax=Paenactinomyces guangxiensis TaxID=1490290 RepID=A0A7W1WUV4_9BACL|nr:polymorphic toxin type 43 domain-containing protein [Paenactinomyces guangxiensis]MBA4496476.1 hypothetical protein [Paenactinomyces guangxiensis]MBH8593598.1 hypothetical protein [Paenactinomyces guangxiensis]
MVNYFRVIIILLLTLVGAGVLGSGTVYADPSFEVPRIDDHFDPVEQGPAPQKTQPVSQNAQEEDGVWDWIKEKASGAWEWTKETASTYWEVSKKMPSYYWNKAKEGDWSAGAMAIISLIAVVVIGYHLGGWDAIVATYKGIVNMIKHPDEAFNHLLYAIQHPIETGKAMWKSISDSWKRDVINGDASSRSRWAGRVVGEIGLAIIGTKGADKAKHIATASKIAQKVSSKVPGTHAAKNLKTKFTNLWHGKKINGKMALFSGLAGTAMVAVGFTYSIPFVKPFFRYLDNCFSYQQTTGYYAVVLSPINCSDSSDGAGGGSGIAGNPNVDQETGADNRKIVGSIEGKNNDGGKDKGTDKIPTWKGSGPAPGVLGVNSSSKSVEAIKNYYPKNWGIEFVFDAKTNTFVVGSPKNGGYVGSPHEKLAQTINADGSKTTLGGTFSRGPNGEIRTTENSGHFGRNWTPELRKQFKEVMKSYGLPVQHEEWK